MKKEYFLLGAIVIVAIVAVALIFIYTQQFKAAYGEKYCKQDSDCSCGVHIKTGECF